MKILQESLAEVYEHALWDISTTGKIKILAGSSAAGAIISSIATEGYIFTALVAIASVASYLYLDSRQKRAQTLVTVLAPHLAHETLVQLEDSF